MKIKIGFIGQGWIGRHYADDFEERLYEVVRYALEEPFVQNKAAISTCNIVFIAVPTPTTKTGFSYDAVHDALTLLAPDTVAVIKSTLLPGTTNMLQEAFPELYVLHSPEFLVERTAAEDARKPKRNLIGIPKETPDFREKAEQVLKILPTAPYSKILTATEAEIVKYAGNCFLYTKVVFMNLLYDYVQASAGNWEVVREAMVNDPRIGESHTTPVHESGHVDGQNSQVRGAGGHCFIKDFAAFSLHYTQLLDDPLGVALLQGLELKNKDLLEKTSKDLDLLKSVYG